MDTYKEKYEAIMSDIDAAILGARDEKTKITLENIKSRNTESEDDRIRKMLFEFFSIKNGEEFKWNGFYIKDILAWLEKQKHNQISDEIKTKRSERVFFYQGKECSWEEMPIKERKHNYPYYFDGDIDCYPFVPKKQKERQDNPDAHEDSWQGEISSSRKDTKFDDYLKATPAERRKMKMTEILDEQKPAECLKPEKGYWYVCIKDFYCGGKKQNSKGDLVQAKGGMYMMGREDISEWFRKAYYDEIKTAEWSEEDEKRIQRICDFLWKNRKGDTDTIYQIEKDADWLKSLRPDSYKKCNSRWKPSEEQMDTLKEILEMRDYYLPYRKALSSLFEDLKTLLKDGTR